MMIRDDNRHAIFLRQLHLMERGNTIVTSQNHLHAVRVRLFDDRFIDSVAILDAIRYLKIYITAQPFKCLQ